MKSFFSVLLVLILSISLSAQPFKSGDKIGQVGIGYGFAGIYGGTTIPPISLGFQYGLDITGDLKDKISLGGIIGYTSSSYDYGTYLGTDWSWTYRYILIGARGEYHFLENSENLDAYGGITVGYAIVSVSEPTGWNGYGYSAGTSYAVFGFHVGARYYFSPTIAVFGELGYGVGYITAGVAFKL